MLQSLLHPFQIYFSGLQQLLKSQCAVQEQPKQLSSTSVLQVGVTETMDVLDNAIAVVINDSRGCLKVSICTVCTFYGELRHFSWGEGSTFGGAGGLSREGGSPGNWHGKSTAGIWWHVKEPQSLISPADCPRKRPRAGMGSKGENCAPTQSVATVKGEFKEAGEHEPRDVI